jgi:hypothetical protein
MLEKIKVLALSGSDTLVIRKVGESKFFITTPDSIIIGRDGFVTLLNFLVSNNFINHKVLEGIIEQYNTK